MANPKPLTADRNELTAEAAQKLQQGICLLLSSWYPIQSGVEHGWAGPNSRDKLLGLASQISNFFIQHDRKEPIYIDDVEDLLEKGLDSFNTAAFPDSVEKVAQQLMIMHEECLQC